MNHRTILPALVAMLAWLPAVGAAAAEPQASPATFYVAPNGNDGWSGTKPAPVGSDGPLATLQAARDAARRAGAAAVRRIVVQAGTYTLGSPLTLDARDSGLTIEAAPGAKATLCGGRRLTDWQRDGDRFWSVSVPDVAADRWDFRVLVVNGRMAPRARLPQTGRFKHLSEFKVRWMSSTGGGWQRKPTPEELTTLRYRPEDLDPWLDPRNAEITVYHMWDESLVGVASVDRQAHTLTFSKPSGHPPGAFGVKDYVVWNVREGMTEPGQWYLDRAAGKVVYWPLPGEDLTRAEAWASAVESLIRLEGEKGAPVRAVTIRGLSLTVTGIPLAPGGFGAGKYEGAVTLSETEDCRLADLAVFHVGGQGVKASNSVNLHVENCDVHHTGAGGIVVRGKGLAVTDNLVHDVGLICPSGIGVFGGGPQSLVAHNEVHDTSYSAVNFSGEDVRIESNLIYRAMKVLHDGAGIYSFSPKRLVMRGNFIRDIADTGGYGASAYYLDERAEDCLVEGNLAFGVARPSHNHMAVRNTIRNNFFVAAGDAEITFPRSSEFTFEKNVVAAGGKITFTNPAAMSTFKDNVLWSGVGKIEGVVLRDYAAAGAEAMTVTGADPKLLPGAEEGVCRFAPDSPALKLGIRPIDVSGAGRRTLPPPPPDAAATAVPVEPDPPARVAPDMFYKARTSGNMWDTWLYQHAGIYYLYYLCRGPKTWDAFAAAESADGVSWREIGYILKKREDAVWMGTGSTWRSPQFPQDKRFFLNFSEWRGNQQTIFFAESADLVHWNRLGDELEFKPDPRWYNVNRGGGSRWDCIWTIPRPEGGLYGYWTATPKPETGGRFGFGRSMDGVTWEALEPPKVDGAGAGEVGAIEKIGSKYYLMFGSGGKMNTLIADQPTGPFRAAAKNRVLLSGNTYFSRFFRTGEDLLVNHHTIAQNREVFFAPLKLAVVDEEGTLRLKWWRNNDRLKQHEVAVRVPQPLDLSRPQLLANPFDIKGGLVLEGVVSLPAPEGKPVGLYLPYAPDAGVAILLAAGGLTRFGEMKPDGSGFETQNEVDRGLAFGAATRFRLLLKGSLLEFYLDDHLIQCWRLPRESTGQLGLICPTAESIKDLKAWQCTPSSPSARGPNPQESAVRLIDKTLVAWISPANLTQRGRSVLTLDDRQPHFDGIIFGELAPGEWMAGSDIFRRMPKDQDAWPEATQLARSAEDLAPVAAAKVRCVMAWEMAPSNPY